MTKKEVSSDIIEPRNGLINPCSLCYMISALQALASCNSFVKDLIELDLGPAPVKGDIPDSTEQSLADYNLLRNLQLFFTSLYSLNEDAKPTALDPVLEFFYNEVGEKVSIFEQKDASEFLNIILDRIEKAALAEVSIKTKKLAPIPDGIYKLSKTLDNFYITIDHELKHKCGHDSCTPRKHQSLLAEVTDGDLVDCIKSHMKPQTIPSYRCDKNCEPDVTEAVETIDPKADLPNYISIQLNRFSIDYRTFTKVKVGSPVDVNYILDLKDLNPNMTQIETKYRLRSVIVHYGDSEDGHYYSYVNHSPCAKTFNEADWYCYNDETVSASDSEAVYKDISGNVKFTSGYMFIYERFDYKQEPIDLKNSQYYEKALENNKKFRSPEYFYEVASQLKGIGFSIDGDDDYAYSDDSESTAKEVE